MRTLRTDATGTARVHTARLITATVMLAAWGGTSTGVAGLGAEAVTSGDSGARAGDVSGPRTVAVREEPAPGEGPAGGFRIDRDGTWFVAVTDTGGLFGFLGHRHAIEVTGWSARVAWDPDEPAASRADFSVPARSLRIDTAQARERAGLDDGPDAETVAELQDKMLGPENLAAAEHPELRLELTEVSGDPEERLRVAGELTIRGRTEPVELPVRVERRDGGGWVFTGSFTVDQSDFGIEPESVAGVVKVADPVEIRFRVAVSRPDA